LPAIPSGPVVLAQVVYDPVSQTIRVQFAPFVDNPAMAAADVIKACANVIQAGEMQKERKPQILVPSIAFK
jgi:hypothetical protein